MNTSKDCVSIDQQTQVQSQLVQLVDTIILGCALMRRWTPQASMLAGSMQPRVHLSCRLLSCASHWSACTAWPNGPGAGCPAS